MRVLVVDDEKIIADMVGLVLQGHGYEIRVAYHPADAIATASAFKPEVLLSDVVMPEMNGIGLAEHFFGLFPDCKVVLMSGNPNSRALLLMAQKRGQNYRFLPKPFHPGDLLKILEGFQNAGENAGDCAT